MRYIVYLLVSSLLACTTFVKTGTPESELQRGIRAGEVVVPGDEIRLTTSDQQVIELTVKKVTPDAIEGELQSVPIDSIQTLEVRRFSTGRAVAIGTGTVLFSWWLIGLLLSMIVVFPA